MKGRTRKDKDQMSWKIKCPKICETIIWECYFDGESDEKKGKEDEKGGRMFLRIRRAKKKASTIETKKLKIIKASIYYDTRRGDDVETKAF